MDGDRTPRRAASAPLWKRALPVVVMLGVVAFVFGFVLPQFIDHRAVFSAIGRIDAWEWAVLVALALLRILPEGLVFAAAQPGTDLSRGGQLFLVSNAMAMVPPARSTS